MVDNNKATLFAVFFLGLCAIVAIIISVVSLTRAGPPSININSPQQGQGQSNSRPQAPQQQRAPQVFVANGGAAGGGMAIDAGGAAYPVGTSGRIFSLAIGHDYGSHEYFDDKGYLNGFGLGMIDLVCEEAGIDCRIVWDRYDNCWDSQIGQHATGGQGLHDRWYDACTGWYTTIERIHVFNFAAPYLKEPTTNFYVLPKNRNFDPEGGDLSSKKILFLEGWASDEKCLYRELKVKLGEGKAAYFPDEDKAMEMLNSGDWDAIYTTKTTVQERLNSGALVKIGKDYSCMIAGNSIMTRKDSDLPSQWNRGFNKIKTNGRFKKYCKEANDAHKNKGHVVCVDSF